MAAEETGGASASNIIIAGGGIGGLIIGLILERANSFKPLGAAMSFGVNILPFFEQIGLLDDILQISMPVRTLDLYDANMKPVGNIGMKDWKKIARYDSIVFSRPRLHHLLVEKTLPSKLLFGKRILRIKETIDRVQVYCSDGSFYDAEMVIGADDAYSAVRQNRYKEMDSQGILPESNKKNLTIDYICMVGVAEHRGPEKICWDLSVQACGTDAKAQQFRNSEWTSESDDSMIKKFYDLSCPWSRKMDEIIIATPKD
ncbi:hypothetical protein BG011_003127 [Mortierella polycephala]|uniref:FAD-binding domain-containing protein n=1 Tax=Mortierella polycephala TaxID=41804 RepID=A0A9P6QDP6_9FUNG|nr:hypothetical protein BG011_003127 [Mortierella polycephala]